MISGDTTGQAGTSSESDNPLPASGATADTLTSLPDSMAVNADDVASMPCALPPSPPMDTDQLSTMDEKLLQASNCEESDGYASCSSSMLATTEEAPDTVQPVQPSSADTTSGLFQCHTKQMPAASKYRLRCQCGAKNCRQYLY